jgi:hypothetical protein
MAKRLCGTNLHPYARLLKQISLIMIKIIAPLITLEYKINCWLNELAVDAEDIWF